VIVEGILFTLKINLVLRGLAEPRHQSTNREISYLIRWLLPYRTDLDGPLGSSVVSRIHPGPCASDLRIPFRAPVSVGDKPVGHRSLDRKPIQ
jgi:hypothetical protein